MKYDDDSLFYYQFVHIVHMGNTALQGIPVDNSVDKKHEGYGRGN